MQHWHHVGVRMRKRKVGPYCCVVVRERVRVAYCQEMKRVCVSSTSVLGQGNKGWGPCCCIGIRESVRGHCLPPYYVIIALLKSRKVRAY